MPELNRLLHITSVVLNPISGLYAAFIGRGCQFRRLGSNQRPPPLQGGALPPELHRNQFRDAGRSRTCLIVGLQPTAWPSGPGVFVILRASGGTRTHCVRLTRAVPGLSSIAGV